MTRLDLPGLSGHTPLGALAGFGVLAMLAEPIAGRARETALSWTEGLMPHAVLNIRGWRGGIDSLVVALDADRQAWLASPILTQRDDLVMAPAAALRWGAEVAEKSPAEIRLWRSLISPDPLLVSNGGNAAYTPLKFTSGNQRFLANVRDLATVTTPEDMRSAITDGTVRDDTLPSLRWDRCDDRPPATPIRGRAARPVGAEWLAFRGLTLLPPVDQAHKFPAGDLVWPVNDQQLSLDELRDLMTDPARSTRDIRRGRARIVIEDRSAYGHFSPSLVEPPRKDPGAVPDGNGHAELVGVDKIADEFGVQPSTWRAYVARGQAPAPAKRIGRTPLWSWQEVWTWHTNRTGRWPQTET